MGAGSKVKIAAVQKSPIFLNKEKTIEAACGYIQNAAAQGAKLIVFPEAFISGYPDWVWTVPPSQKKQINELYLRFLENAVVIGEKSLDPLLKAGKEYGIYVAMGINERNSEASNSSVFNTLLYISPDGKVLGKHRKLIPTGGERLMWAGGDGSTLVSFDSDIGRLGGLICWENYMPLARYAMYQQGVQIYLAPTWDSSSAWQIAMRHIAREGGMFVVGCCQGLKKSDIPDEYEFKKLYPEDREWINKGNSCIVNPKGEIIGGPLDSEQDIIYAEIDLEVTLESKWMFDAAGHYNRPDVFDFSVKK
jgi:nitrilase